MGVSGLLQRPFLQRLEEAGAGRQRSAAGPLVPKEPDPAVEVAAEAEMKKALGDTRGLSSTGRFQFTFKIQLTSDGFMKITCGLMESGLSFIFWQRWLLACHFYPCSFRASLPKLSSCLMKLCEYQPEFTHLDELLFLFLSFVLRMRLTWGGFDPSSLFLMTPESF